MEGNERNEVNERDEGEDQIENLSDQEDYDPFMDEEDYGGEEGSFDFGGSEPSPLGGIYGLFKDTLDRKDSRKVSNLSNEELGSWNLSVRDCERIALIANTFKHPGVATFFQEQSRIITDTAMSKKGWFTELFVTSKKYASRDSSSSILSLPQTKKKDKWKIFSGKGNQQQTQEVV